MHKTSPQKRNPKMKEHQKVENVISIQIKPAGTSAAAEATTIENKRESKEKQARSFLRDEFLGILFTITNQPVQIQFDKTRDPLDATFAGSDFTFSTISVRQLKTAIGEEPHSLLRTSDISSISYQVQL